MGLGSLDGAEDGEYNDIDFVKLSKLLAMPDDNFHGLALYGRVGEVTWAWTLVGLIGWIGQGQWAVGCGLREEWC